MTLKPLIEQSDTTAGRTFDFVVQFLVLLSLATFSIETIPDLPTAHRRLLSIVEVATVAAFTVEYGLRLLVADRKLGFVFSFFGLVDLIAILPFYLAIGVDLRAIRVVRFMRLFRLLKLTRYSTAIRRFKVALLEIREELLLFGAVTMILLYVSAVGIYFFERNAQPEIFASIFHSLWWSVSTLTTVGYGDAYPVTVGGRIFTFVVLIVGLGVVAVPAGLLSSALSRSRAADSEETAQLP